jgi:hypothetical protein
MKELWIFYLDHGQIVARRVEAIDNQPGKFVVHFFETADRELNEWEVIDVKLIVVK